MTICALLLDSGGLKFDFTITLGSILAFLAFLAFLFSGLKFWSLQVESKKDLEWRVKNLEDWKIEHIAVTKKHGEIIDRMDRLVERIEDYIGMRDQRKMNTVRTRKDD